MFPQKIEIKKNPNASALCFRSSREVPGFMEEVSSLHAVCWSCAAKLLLAAFSKEKFEEMCKGLWCCLWKQTFSFYSPGPIMLPSDISLITCRKWFEATLILKGIILRLWRFIIIDVNNFRRGIGSFTPEFHPVVSELSSIVALCYFNNKLNIKWNGILGDLQPHLSLP